MSSPSVERIGRRPRVRHVPAYSSSAGKEAVDLARLVGLVLDDWQADVLVDALGEKPDGSWASNDIGLIVPRQNGKGAIVEARELAGLVLFGEELILHSAHEFKTAAEAFRRVVKWFKNSDYLRRRVKKIMQANGEQGIELRNGARLRFVARSKGSGRGFSGNCVILDEAYALTPTEMAALIPTMSAVPNSQTWYTSTPPEHPAATLVQMRARAGSPGLCYLEWSPPEEYKPTPKALPATDADRRMWAACNPAMGIRITEQFTEQSERSNLPDEEFARERLGAWPPSVNGSWLVIGEGAWHGRRDPLSEPLDPVSWAVDVNPAGTHAAIGVAARRADGDLHVELVEYREGITWVVPRMVALKGKWTTCAVAVDPASPAGSLIPALREAGIDVFEITGRAVGQAFGLFLFGITGHDQDATDTDENGDDSERPAVAPIWWRCAPDMAEALTAAVKGATKRQLGAAHAWDRGEHVDISPLVAVTNAAYAHAVTASLVMDVAANIW